MCLVMRCTKKEGWTSLLWHYCQKCITWTKSRGIIRQTQTEGQSTKQTAYALRKCQCHERLEKAEDNCSRLCMILGPEKEIALKDIIETIGEIWTRISFFLNLFIFGCVGSSLLCAGFSLVVASGGYSLLRCAGFSLRWLLLLWSTGSRHTGFSSCGAWA